MERREPARALGRLDRAGGDHDPLDATAGDVRARRLRFGFTPTASDQRAHSEHKQGPNSDSSDGIAGYRDLAHTPCCKWASGVSAIAGWEVGEEGAHPKECCQFEVGCHPGARRVSTLPDVAQPAAVLIPRIAQGRGT